MTAQARNNFNRGVILIEMLAYLSVLAIVITTVIIFAVNLVRNERALNNRIRIISEADFAMRHITDAGLEAVRIRKSSGSPASVFDTTASHCINECRLVLDLSDDGTETAEFFVNTSGRLTMKRTGALENYELEINSPRISTLEFIVQCIGNGSPCENDPVEYPKSVRVKLTIRDFANVTQVDSLTTSLTPQAY